MQELSPPLVVWTRKLSKWTLRQAARASKSPRFKRFYAFFGAFVLLGTVVFWAILGAHLQQHNADQLSDVFLFRDAQTFHGAQFPGAHTFLLKWPIFWLLNVVGVSSTSLLLATLAVTLSPIIVLVAIVYKLDKRPLVFGTVCLALALALLLVPAQPYAGGLLPVNMAMLTTRNLEYALYLAVLVLFAKAHKIHRPQFLVAVVLLAVLIASDKLFLSLSAGGALVAIAVYALRNNWQLTAFAARWLAGTLAATVLATAMLAGITASHLTNLVNSTSATPYGIVLQLKNLVLGSAYALLGLFTNAGANPAYDNRVLSQLPGDIVERLWSPSGPAYLVTICLVLYGLVQLVRFVWPAIRSPKGERLQPKSLFAISLVWTSVAAIGVFIVTDHYYAVDARYLTISLFALVVVTVMELRKREWQWPEDLLLIGGTFLIAIGIAIPTALHIHNQQAIAYSAFIERNNKVAAALEQHKVDVLVGDYWRVIPIKFASQDKINVMPLTGCTQAASVLTSTVWQPDLAKHSFAYLVTLDGSLTNFPQCKLTDITATYGRPNATQIIAGSPDKPAEALLFYNQGSRPLSNTAKQSPQANIFPVTVDDLKDRDCQQSTTMNIVAHQDDDLLFLSPDLLHDIQSGRCVRTVFLTAGDAGSSRYYWINRQLGSEAAYNSMLGSSETWDHLTLTFGQNEYVTVANPHGNKKISLIFFNLPDGNINGRGFTASGHESLARLLAGTIPDLRTVDGQSTYTAEQLTAALSSLMAAYQPADIHTQADVPSEEFPDHSDHIATGKFALQAAAEYGDRWFNNASAVPVIRYIGYPVHGYAVNVTGDDLLRKQVAFFAYGQYDGGVCHTIEECAQTPTYNAYISRQYTENPTEY